MADANNQASTFSLTAPAILAFNRGLFEAKAFQGKGDPKFSCQLVLAGDHPDLDAIKNVIRKVANEASPGIDINSIGKPLRSGTREADKLTAKHGAKYQKLADLERGKVVIISRSKFAPRLSVIVPGQGVVALSDDALRAKYKDKFFPGAEVIAEFNLVWYGAMKDGDKPGVTAYVQQVLATGKGERLGGGRSAQEAFSGYLGGMSAASPLGGPADDDDFPM